MTTKGTRDLPARLEGLRRRFDQWRRKRKGRERIPEPLWVAAVKTAGRYGLHRTARALRVDYYALKKRMDETSAVTAGRAAATAGKRSAGASGAKFLELPVAAWPGGGECMLELEDAAGAKIRVHLKGFEMPDLAALSRSFWQNES